MNNKGNNFVSQSNQISDVQKNLLQILHDGRKENEESIQLKIKEIEDLIQNHDPLDIIANVSLRNSITNPEDFKEYESKINPAYTEYIALLCLTHPYDFFNSENLEPFPPMLIEDIQNKVQQLFTAQSFHLAFKNVDPDKTDSPDVIDRLRTLTLMESLIVRYPDYHHHYVEDLKGIFVPLAKEMENTIGCNIDEAISIFDKIGEQIYKRLIEKREMSLEEAKNLRKAVRNFRQKRKKKQAISKYPKKLLEELVKERPSIATKHINNISLSWIFLQLGQTFSFTIEEIAEITNLAPKKIFQFLERFSIEFGQVDILYRTPAPTHPLMQKPFIKHHNGYFCPVINLAYWSLRSTIENYWNPESKTRIVDNDSIWQKYLRSRSMYLEKTVIEVLSNALKFSTTYKNLKYSIYNEKGEKIETELDGLIILDNKLFLIEVKSGSLSLPARRGAPKSIKEDLEKLVEEAYSQALRASNYISKNERPVFQLTDGSQINLDRSKFNEVFLITVTLDDLDSFITNTHELKKLGFLKGNQYPWTISLANLRVICEMIEFSSQLIHYIKRRLHLNELGWVNAHDELDWFGHYLLEGLYFDDIKEGMEENTLYNLLSYSWIFDDYYFYITGQRQTPVNKPTQPMPTTMRQVLLELEAKHNPGFIDAACCLLEMSNESREKLFNEFIKLRKDAQKDRQEHSFTMLFLDSDFGFSFIVRPIELSKGFYAHALEYSILKKYQTKVSKWTTIDCISDTSNWVEHFLVLEKKWIYDKKLDTISSQYLKPLPNTINTDKQK